MNKEEELIRKKSPVNIRNKKASFEYFFIETFTAGIVLTGTEIKSIRLGKASLVDTYCTIMNSLLQVEYLLVVTGATFATASTLTLIKSEVGTGTFIFHIYSNLSNKVYRLSRKGTLNPPVPTRIRGF